MIRVSSVWAWAVAISCRPLSAMVRVVFEADEGIRESVASRGVGEVYTRQVCVCVCVCVCVRVCVCVLSFIHVWRCRRLLTFLSRCLAIHSTKNPAIVRAAVTSSSVPISTITTVAVMWFFTDSFISHFLRHGEWT